MLSKIFNWDCVEVVQMNIPLTFWLLITYFGIHNIATSVCDNTGWVCVSDIRPTVWVKPL